MSDIFSNEKRSQIMASVKSINTRPEIVVRKYLFACGFRYRINHPKLPGKPDIVLPKYKTVVFIHGCFWHGHRECEASQLPKTRLDYWSKKIESNSLRDKKNVSSLRIQGWQVIIVWTCQLSNKSKKEKALTKLVRMISKP